MLASRTNILPLRSVAVCLTLLLALVATGCADNEYAPPAAPPVYTSRIRFYAEELTAESRARYYTFAVESDGEVEVSCSAPWVTLRDTLLSAAGGNVTLCLEANGGATERECDIVCRLAGDTTALRPFHIRQRTALDEDATNAITAECLGRGYNKYMDYTSPLSVQAPVIDEEKLHRAERELGETLLRRENRSAQSIEYHAAETLFEMLRYESNTSDKKRFVFGQSSTVVEKFREYASETTSFGHARLMRIAGSNDLDAALIKYAVGHDIDLFTDAFNADRAALLAGTMPVKDFMNRYGTDLIIHTDAGGYVDIWVEFHKQLTQSARRTTEHYSNRVFGIESSAGSTDTEENASDLKASVRRSQIEVAGGNTRLADELQGRLNRMEYGATAKVDDYADWLATVTNNDRAAVIALDIMPLWELIPDAAVRRSMEDYDARLLRESPAYTTLMQGGGRNTVISGIDAIAFTGETLVKLIRNSEGKPVAEVCNEYVPAIRGDRRVNVIYPLINGTPSLRHGIYPGDGAGRSPLYVSFVNGRAEVMPYGQSDPIRSLHLINGSFYSSSMGLSPTHSGLSPEDCYLTLLVTDPFTFEQSTLKQPIVKIGNNCWARAYTDAHLEFGCDDGWGWSEDYYYDTAARRWYFNVLDDVSPMFAAANAATFGATAWYLPRDTDVANLMTYIGGNAKALFKGQQTGFEADFRGYYGNSDLFTGAVRGDYGIQRGDYCFIPYKTGVNSGRVAVLDADYTLRTLSLDATAENRFSVRLCRNERFRYQ